MAAGGRGLSRLPRAGGLARDSLWSLAAIVLVGLSAAAFNALVGRKLGIVALGQVGVALALGLGAAQLATAGIAPAVTRFGAGRLAAGDRAGARRALATGIFAALGLGLLFALLLWGLGPAARDRIGLPASLAAATAGLILLQSAYIVSKAALYGLGRVGAYARAELPAALAFAAGLAWVLVAHDGPAILPFLGANAVFVIWAAWLLRVAWPRAGAEGAWSSDRQPSDLSTGMPRYVLIAGIGSAAALARLQLVVLVTAAAWPAAEVGRLQAALTFLPPVMLLPRALELALLPRLAGDWGAADVASFRHRGSLALRISVLALSLAAGGLALSGAWLLDLLFGPAFAAATPALLWILLAAAALGLAVPAVSALSGADGIAVPNAAGLAGLIVSLLAWAAWVPELGATGAAIGLAAGSLVNAAIPILWGVRRYRLAWHASAAGLARALLLLVPSWLVIQSLGLHPLLAALAYVILLLAWERRSWRSGAWLDEPSALVSRLP